MVSVVESLYPKYILAKNKVLDLIKGKPDLIIIGETHTDETHDRIEADLIRRLQPEVVLLEGYNDKEPELIEHKLYEYITLDSILVEKDSDLEVLGLDEDALSQIKDAVEKRLNIFNEKGRVPKNIRDLTKTPLYEFRAEFLFALCGAILERGSAYMDQKHNFFEENLDDVKERGIKNVPEISELGKKQDACYAISNYLLRLSEQDFSCERQLHAAYDIGAKVGGCDMANKCDGLRNSSDDDLISHFISMDDTLEELKPLRETAMGHAMVESVRRREDKTRPVIAIVGKNHVKEDSGVYSILDDAGVNYRVLPLMGTQQVGVLEGLKYRFDIARA